MERAQTKFKYRGRELCNSGARSNHELVLQMRKKRKYRGQELCNSGAKSNHEYARKKIHDKEKRKKLTFFAGVQDIDQSSEDSSVLSGPIEPPWLQPEILGIKEFRGAEVEENVETVESDELLDIE